MREWLAKQKSLPNEIGIFVRSESELPRAQAVAPDGALVTTMHSAKGLEFKTVVVMACDEDVLPSPERLESAPDPSDQEEIYNTERHLLYVACTRARDALFISGVHPASEFLRDMQPIGAH